MRFFWLGFIASIAFFSNAFAEDLAEVYQLAVANDQLFQNATATRQATAENLPQAIAALLPNINGIISSQMNRTWTTNANPNFATNGLVKYNSRGYELNLSMPIIDFNQWYQVSAAKAAVKAADANYAAAAQDLIIRTVTAYFNVLEAEDNLDNAHAQATLLSRQFTEAKARFSVGVDAITSVYNVQANYATAVAQEIAAKNNLYAAYQNLQVITKDPINRLSKLKNNLPLIKPTPDNFLAWQKSAESHNFSLLALRYQAAAARTTISANRANHLPVLSTVNSYSYSHESPNDAEPSGLQQKDSTLGLQLSVPLFSGGAVNSQTRQAQDLYVEALTNLEQQHRQITAQVFQNYSAIIAGISKIKADEAAVLAAESALKSNQAAYQVGTMTIVDVLTSLHNLYQAKQNLAADKYSYLINTLNLKRLAGNLSNLDILALNHDLDKTHTLPMNTLNSNNKQDLNLNDLNNDLNDPSLIK